MIGVMITHEVEDVDHWLASTLKFEMAARLGLSPRVYVDPAGSKLVGVVVEVPSVEFILKHLNSPQNKEAMKQDGVLPHTMRLLITP